MKNLIPTFYTWYHGTWYQISVVFIFSGFCIEVRRSGIVTTLPWTNTSSLHSHICDQCPLSQCPLSQCPLSQCPLPAEQFVHHKKRKMLTKKQKRCHICDEIKLFVSSQNVGFQFVFKADSDDFQYNIVNTRITVTFLSSFSCRPHWLLQHANSAAPPPAHTTFRLNQFKTAVKDRLFTGQNN